MSMNRRTFLRSIAGAASAAALVGKTSEAEEAALPSPSSSKIEHIIVVMMENRSFDHLLGWLPGANGRQAGLHYLDKYGEAHWTNRLTTTVGCSHPDPDHSYAAGRGEYAHGRLDGWMWTGENDSFAIGYYEEADLPFYGALARNFTTLDNYFSSILGPTYPNRIFQYAAQTDRLSNSSTLSKLQTIWDRLAEAKVSHRYYYSNIPFLTVWGTKYRGISALFSEFLKDAANGTLPAVSFVDPKFTIQDNGQGNDDHPHADLRAGEAFMGEVYRAVTHGPGWKNTVLIINRDEWGGFFDTVTPPRVIAPNDVDKDLVDGKALLGFRVPVFVVSPFTRGKTTTPRINSGLYDHTSVLKLIEWRYGLRPLTRRDASSEIGNLASALNFAEPEYSVPYLPVIKTPDPTACALFDLSKNEDNESYDFYDLMNSELAEGWTIVRD
jgi:phospholipase C